jgi:hypothetical protein
MRHSSKLRPALTVVATLRGASPIIWRISFDQGGRDCDESIAGCVGLGLLSHHDPFLNKSLSIPFAFGHRPGNLQLGTGTHSPRAWKPLPTPVRLIVYEDSPTPFGSRNLRRKSRLPRLKVAETARFDDSPTPRSQVYKGSLRGRSADVSPFGQVNPPQSCARPKGPRIRYARSRIGEDFQDV